MIYTCPLHGLEAEYPTKPCPKCTERARGFSLIEHQVLDVLIYGHPITIEEDTNMSNEKTQPTEGMEKRAVVNTDKEKTAQKSVKKDAKKAGLDPDKSKS